MKIYISAFVALSITATLVSADESMTITTKQLSYNSAFRVAVAAMAACRKKGIQVGVTVTDRSGSTQVFLRDSLAPNITEPISHQKANTAIAFLAATSALENRFPTSAGVGAKTDGLIMTAGGIPIQAAGAYYGAVGVAGAADPLVDEQCAAAGVEEIVSDLEMEE